jgi:hypothetical protein
MPVTDDRPLDMRRKVAQAPGPDHEEHTVRDLADEWQFIEQRVVRSRLPPDVIESVDENDLGLARAAGLLTQGVELLAKGPVQRIKITAAGAGTWRPWRMDIA